MSQPAHADEPGDDVGPKRDLPLLWQVVLAASAIGTVSLAIYTVFNLGAYTGHVFLETVYFYGILGLLLPLAFVLYPAHPGAPRDRVPWYDAALFLVTAGLCVYFLWNAENILSFGWEFVAPVPAVWAAIATWALVLDAARRAGGLAVFAVILVASLYPVLAPWAPGPLSGEAQTFTNTALFHVYGTESIIGIPLRAFAQLVLGFLVFGVALQHTGGGRFFLDLAFAALGHSRGGPAKVAIFSSGLMGSVSGSVVTNVMTTGVMTIPTMRKVGFRPSYAAGVEACASTGGVLMPPIMGATAFVMATFLDIPYSDIVYAAIIPSALYFGALFIQIDGYAARHGLVGLPRSELPKIGATLKAGWYFVTVFVLLIFMLLVMKQEQLAPYYATALLLAVNQVLRTHRWGWRQLYDFVLAMGALFVELAAVLTGVGLIIGALVLTGKIGSLAYDLVAFAGDSPFVLLIVGAITSFILGMGMTVTAAYVFLAVTLAPALTGSGLNVLAVHLFMLYWGMLSYITPPVAIGAFAAASVAGAPPMRTAFEAMRLGSIIYFVPFFFVLNPALIGIGQPAEIVLVVASAFVGIFLLAAGLQGYLLGAGNLSAAGMLEWPLRATLVVAGLLMALPGGDLVGFTSLEILAAALTLAVPATAATWILARRREPGRAGAAE